MPLRRTAGVLSAMKKLAPVTTTLTIGLAAATAPASGASGPPRTAAAPASTHTAMPKPPAGKVAISEAGSTLLEPLFGLWASGYHKHYANVTITPSGGGSGEGISDAAGGTVDVGASDAYLSGTDKAQYPGLRNIALAISSQMVNYNIKGIPASTHLKLSGPLLAEMYQGKVTNWDDPAIKKLNPMVKLPNEAIAPLHRSDASGDTFLFTTYLSDADGGGWGKSIGYGTSVSFPNIPGALGEEGNGGMVSGCKTTPGCVAYIGISYRSDTNGAHLGEAALRNKAGHFELPVAGTITAEAKAFTNKTPDSEAISMIYGSASRGYPIINYEYAIVPAKETSSNEAQAVAAFLDWAVQRSGGNASKYLSQVNFEPLPPQVVGLSEKLIAKIGG
jgi:phosphate transport system substrate-binding protein